jgi:predicted nucleic acid-binding protein
LLQADGIDVVIPLPVLEEVSDPADPADPIVQAIRDAGWQVATVSSPVPGSVSRWKLDKGEESVITLALENPGCEVVIDDLAGRKCAEAHGIPLLGSIGVVILARRIGRIPAARPVIVELRNAGLYVTDDVIAKALKPVGE